MSGSRRTPLRAVLTRCTGQCKSGWAPSQLVLTLTQHTVTPISYTGTNQADKPFVFHANSDSTCE